MAGVDSTRTQRRQGLLANIVENFDNIWPLNDHACEATFFNQWSGANGQKSNQINSLQLGIEELKL